MLCVKSRKLPLRLILQELTAVARVQVWRGVLSPSDPTSLGNPATPLLARRYLLRLNPVALSLAATPRTSRAGPRFPFRYTTPDPPYFVRAGFPAPPAAIPFCRAQKHDG